MLQTATTGTLDFIVVGDIIIDEYSRGTVTRLDQASSVPICDAQDRWTSIGGAGNVAAMLAMFGYRVRLVGVGTSEYDRHAQRPPNLTTSLYYVDGGTAVKQRILDQHNRLIARIDLQPAGCLEGFASHVMAQLEPGVPVVVVDYDKGAVTYELLTALRAHDAPLALSLKPHDWLSPVLKQLKPWVLVENQKEVCEILGHTDAGATDLRHFAGADHVMVTEGSMGCFLSSDMAQFSGDYLAYRVPVVDTTCAGDAAFVGLLAGLQYKEPGAFAMAAGAAEVQRVGTYPVNALDVIKIMGADDPATKDVTSCLARLGWAAANARSYDNDDPTYWYPSEVGVTCGVFDMLHLGHIATLQQARELSGFLVVLVNDDASAQRIKGEGRPVQPLSERMAVLAALPFVDAVASFSEDSPVAQLKALRPRYFIKGGTTDTVPEEATVQQYGGRVILLDKKVPNCSTSATIEKVLAQCQKPKKSQST
jgi:D-beta-D-heptose 7-phosphate kinase/D-beta-D-heptose 1-phosphate adenosyltransferase